VTDGLQSLQCNAGSQPASFYEMTHVPCPPSRVYADVKELTPARPSAASSAPIHQGTAAAAAAERLTRIPIAGRYNCSRGVLSCGTVVDDQHKALRQVRVQNSTTNHGDRIDDDEPATAQPAVHPRQYRPVACGNAKVRCGE